jgi:glutamine amidotransferase
MCRHVAYLGPPVGIAKFLLDAPHGLVEQAAAPKLQTSTPTNPDGWGVAWYGPAAASPVRYRTAVPVWDDVEFVQHHATTTAGAFVAAVRAASPGSRLDATNNAPFVHGSLMFSLNGFIKDFRTRTGDELRSRLSKARLAALEGDVDSEVVLGLVLDRLDAGDPPPAAVASVATSVHDLAGGRLNLLLSDGAYAVATTLGNSLFVRNATSATVIASEPLDSRRGWNAVPDASLVTATAGNYEIRPLAPS